MMRTMSQLKILHVLQVLIVTLFISGCGAFDGSSSALTRQSVRPFVLNQAQFNVRVRYQNGAEPYVGNLASGVCVWSITEMNLKGSLPDWVANVSVPHNLSQMSRINSPIRGEWTQEALKELAFETNFSQQGLTNNTITAYYLLGNYKKNPAAMGLHFHGSSVVFIFKDIVRSLGGTRDSQSFTEQAAIMHEIGHAFGLVNGYVQMTWGPHEDPHSKSHCTNRACVMYRRSDGVQGYQQFRIREMLGRSEDLFNLFGQECNVDLQNFYQQGCSGFL